MKKNIIIVIAISFIMAIILLTSGVVILVTNNKQESGAAQITESAVGLEDKKEESAVKAEKTEEKEEKEENREVYIQDKADMELLLKYQEYNSDVIGTIHIKDTVLDHPLVQTISDEEYYLYKDLDKKYNSHGVPFLSAASLMEGQGRNCVIYGHNISKHKDDVFADLARYRDVEFYKEHPIVKTVSKSGTRNWLIIAYFIVDNADEDPFMYSEETDFLSKKSFIEYFEEVEKRNWLDVPVELSYGDTFLTLSSCSLELAGSGTNRMVVIAKQLYADEEYQDIVERTVKAEKPLLPERLR